MKVEFHATIGSIADRTGGKLINGEPGKEIDSITTDSREIGRDSLFVPIIGERYDGHQFIDQLIKEKRIAGFLTMKKEYARVRDSGVAAILCDDTLKAYGALASSHRSKMQAIIIAITGTNGKTSTKELIWSILNRKDKTLKNEKSYNNEIGVPYTLLYLRDEHRWAVIELGMNHKGEIDILSNISKPDIALITNIGEGHLEFLGTMEDVALAKSEIMHGMKQGSLIILNRDSMYFDILYNKACELGHKIKTFGLSGDADVKPAGYEMFRDSLRLNYNNYEYDIPVYGIQNIYNALAAIAVVESLGVESEIIKDGFNSFKSVDMRSQLIDVGYTIINDTYNSNPLSARYAVRSMQEIFPVERKVAILSDMKELGSFSKKFHRELGKQVYEAGIELLLTWGEMAENISSGARESGMKEKAIHFSKKDDLIEFTLRNITNNDVILIKGSRSMRMEEVVEALVR